MSLEEIKAALADEKVKGELLDFILPDAQKHLEGKGHVIRTPEQDEAYYKNKFEADVKTVISDLHKKYDDDIFEATGERKQPTQKTYEFLKEKIKALKEKASQTGDKVDQDKLNQLQELLNKANSEKETAVKEIHEKYFKKGIEGDVANQFDKAAIETPQHLKTDEEKQTYVSNQKRMLKNDFLLKYTAKEDKDGNPVYYLGETLQSDTKDGSALSAAQIIERDYGQYFIKEGKKQAGAGTGKGEKPAAGFTTKAEVHKYLAEKGMDPNTKAYGDELLKLVKEYGIID